MVLNFILMLSGESWLSAPTTRIWLKAEEAGTYITPQNMTWIALRPLYKKL
jgi:hypothetical protein